jgi:hypothetical protein
MTGDLAAFLAARLDEDEAVAKDEHERVWFGPYPETLAEREGWIVIQQERALREAAAKRAILNYESAGLLGGLHIDGWGMWRDALKCLAAVYSDHPDYRDEWKLDIPPISTF